MQMTTFMQRTDIRTRAWMYRMCTLNVQFF